MKKRRDQRLASEVGLLATRLIVAVIVHAGAAHRSSVHAEDWPQFRGPTGLGYTQETGLPVVWGGEKRENVLWQAPLIGEGHASPIVWKDRVFVSTARWGEGVADRTKVIPEHHVLCYRSSDGELLWDTRVEPGPWLRTDFRSGPGGGYAAPTPATNGTLVFVAFGSSVLAALDFQGRIAWRNEIVPYTFDVTLGSSPVLFEGNVILLCAMAKPEDSRIVAFEASTGAKVREARLPTTGFGHSTPVIVDVGVDPRGDRVVDLGGDLGGKPGMPARARPQMLVLASGASVAPEALQSFDPRTFERIWWCRGSGDAASPAYAAGVVYFDSGRWGPGTAVEIGGQSGEGAKDGVDDRGGGKQQDSAAEDCVGAKGGAAAEKDVRTNGIAGEKRVRWTIPEVPEAIGSPIILGEHVYRLHSPGILKCWRLATGEQLCARRLEGISTTWASPVATPDARIYFASAGKSYVMQAGPELKVLAVNDLGDSNHASPAVSGGRIFFLGLKKLHCVGKR